MEVLNPLRVVKVLRRELEVRRISGREIDRRLSKQGRESIRQSLKEGSEGKMSLERLASMLEAAEIDGDAFLGLVAGCEVPLMSLVEALGGGEKPSWTRAEKAILWAVKARRPQGEAGFAESLPALRRVEALREDDPPAADELAWQTLERATESGEPGAIAGALAVVAGGSARERARALLEMAFEIVGADPPAGLLAGKIVGQLGRLLAAAGYPRQALRILRYRAYPDVELFGGDGDDRAFVLLSMFHAGRGGGEPDFGITCLERAIACGGEAWRFAALHQLAATRLAGGGEPERTARHYDELLAMPHLATVPPATRALVRCRRLSAHLRAGQLGEADLPEIERTWEESRELLGAVDRTHFALDLVDFLRQLDRDPDAARLLVYEWWTIIYLEDEDEELQKRYSESCKASRTPLNGIGVLRR